MSYRLDGEMMAIRGKRKKVLHTMTTLRIESTSIELARVIARASTTIPMRPRSVGSESAVSEVSVTSMDTSEDSGRGGGDDERVDFLPVFLRGFGAGGSSALISAAASIEDVSTLDFLEARISTLAIDRRFTDTLMGVQVVSTSVKSDSVVDWFVFSSRIGDEEKHVKGEERREGDSERDLERDLVREVDRFGVCGSDKAGPGMTGDG